MKYKKYDIVKIVEPYWANDPSDTTYIGKEAIITNISGGYDLTFLDGSGSSAWWHDCQLSFIKEGNEDIVKAARVTYDKKIQLAQSWSWIKEHWHDKTISSASMSFLMNEIGYHSAFEFNGEYYALFMDFRILYPIFDYLIEGDLDNALKVADKILSHIVLIKLSRIL